MSDGSLWQSFVQNAEQEKQRRQAFRDQQRQDTIAQYMATANNIRRQLGHVDNLQKALALTLDPNTHQPAAGHEQEAARLREQLAQFDLNSLHGNLSNVENFINKLYDPNFNPQTGMEQPDLFRALGEKLHLVKPQPGLAPVPTAGAPARTTAAPSGPGYPTPVVPGNIQWTDRPRVMVPGEEQHTVLSTSIEEDGQVVLIPLVYDGAKHNLQDAIQHYHQTGQHMGKFRTEDEATQYSKQYSADVGQGKYGQGPTVPQPLGNLRAQQKKTAGEMIRDLQGIRQKYDIQAPGIETSEAELGAEAGQRAKEEATRRDIAFTEAEAKRVGASPAEIKELELGKLGGAKPTAKKEQYEVLQGKVGDKPVTWLRNKYDKTDIYDPATGEDVTQDQFAKFVATPKASAANKPRHAWGKEPGSKGRFYSVELDPQTNQEIPGTRNFSEQPPATITGSIRTGFHYWVDENTGQEMRIEETRGTHRDVGGAGGGGGGAAPAAQAVGHKGSTEEAAARKIADVVETDARSANDYMKERRQGNKSPTSDSAIVVSWVRAQVRGAGRMTNVEIEFGLHSGSWGTQFTNAYQRALEGTLDDTFVEQMVADINRAAKSARETADQYKGGGQGQTDDDEWLKKIK